jgi:transcriptional repressor NrdR
MTCPQVFPRTVHRRVPNGGGRSQYALPVLPFSGFPRGRLPTADDGSQIRRRRQCPDCGRRFTTIETASLTVVKRSGVTEPFSRTKVLVGVRKACQGRPVTEDDSLCSSSGRGDDPFGQGNAEVDAHEVGMAILGPLRELDEVAYLRFASVYQAFESLEDFEAAITLLRAEREPRRIEPVAHRPHRNSRASAPAAAVFAR